METMASGLPCIASKIRGNTDMVLDGEGGFTCSPKDIDGLSDIIKMLTEKISLVNAML